MLSSSRIGFRHIGRHEHLPKPRAVGLLPTAAAREQFSLHPEALTPTATEVILATSVVSFIIVCGLTFGGARSLRAGVYSRASVG